MPIVTKLIFGDYMQFMPIHHIKKFHQKILYFGQFVDIIRSK